MRPGARAKRFNHTAERNGFTPDTVLKVVRPLYGIPESGLNWYLTYLYHHVGWIPMNRTKMDPLLLVRKTGEVVEGIIYLQVDD